MIPQQCQLKGGYSPRPTIISTGDMHVYIVVVPPLMDMLMELKGNSSCIFLVAMEMKFKCTIDIVRIINIQNKQYYACKMIT